MHTADVDAVATSPYLPAVHAVHTVDVDAADTLPYAPAKQAVHADVPVVSALYKPAKHAVQAVELVGIREKNPVAAQHTTLVTVTAPAMPAGVAVFDPATWARPVPAVKVTVPRYAAAPFTYEEPPPPPAKPVILFEYAGPPPPPQP